MNSSAINLSLAGLAGVALGLFFFGGLWLTVRRIADSKRPALRMLGSFFVRLLVTLCGFHLAMDGNWKRLLACLAGFLMMRLALTRIVRTGAAASPLSNETGG